MIVFIGLGSNIGSRLFFIEEALRQLAQNGKIVNTSFLYQSEPAYLEYLPVFVKTNHLQLKISPGEKRYLNCVVKLIVPEAATQNSALQLLSRTQQIERTLGKNPATHLKYYPRTIDIDILAILDESNRPFSVNVPERPLMVPHYALKDRRFVLKPLHDIDPNLRVGDSGRTIDELLQSLPKRIQDARSAPMTTLFAIGDSLFNADDERNILMGIVNLTTDSFSGDGMAHEPIPTITQKIDSFASSGAQLIDIGAESTRPGASEVSATIQIQRILPIIQHIATTRTDSSEFNLPEIESPERPDIEDGVSTSASDKNPEPQYFIDTRHSEVIAAVHRILPTVSVRDTFFMNKRITAQ